MESTLIKEFTPYPHTGWVVSDRVTLRPLPTKTLVNDGEAGTGAHSIVYFAVDPASKTRFVVKVGDNDNAPAMHDAVAQYDIAPRIYMQLKLTNRSAAQKELYLVIMDPIKMSLSKYINSTLHFDVDHVLKGIQCLCEKKLLINFFHGDLHTQNIVFMMDGSLGLIDFEFARTEPLGIGVIDLIPLITDLYFNFGARERELARKLTTYVNKLFSATFKLKRLRRRAQGGFEYKGKYVTFDTYGTQYSASDLVKEFPTYQLPLIEE